MTVPEMSSTDEIALRERNTRQIPPEIVRARMADVSFDTFFYDLEK